MSVFTKEGSPYKYCRFTITDKSTGRKVSVYESTRETTISKAKEYEARRKELIKQQLIYGQKPRRTWKEAEERWLTEMQHKRSIRFDINKFEFLEKYLENKYLDEINNELISFIVEEKKNSKTVNKVSTINRLLALIRAVLNKAYKEWGWLNKPLFIKLQPENNKRIRYITQAEVKKLLTFLPEHQQNLVKFSILTGMRQQNVLNLKWADIDFERKVLVIPPENFKQNRFHKVPLSRECLNLLNGIKRVSEYVFTYKGNPITQCNTKAFRKALKKAGIENFRWHDLRHTSASWLVQAGVPENVIQEWFGWDSPPMVKRYAHLAPSNLEAAANKISVSSTKEGVENEVC